MGDQTDLNALLLSTAGGDRAAFRALYVAASPKLLGVALRICGERGVAEDALQDAFVEIWRKADTFDTSRGAALGWMAVIVRNRAIDQLRRRGRGPALGSGGEDADDAAARIVDISAPADGGADGLALEQCLGRLEDRAREMVVLAYCEGYSREELSERYDAPVNTVKTWLRRGLAELKECLEE